ATVEGIQAIGNAAVTVTVADTVTGATTGLSLTGGTGGTGDISVAGAGGFIGGSGDAANIRNNGAGSTTVSISGASSSAGGEGIVVRDTIAGGDISVTTGAVTALAAGMDGIDIQSLSLTGDVAVFANGNVQAGNAGIVAALVSAGATGNVEVTANGSVTGTFGIDAENLGSGSVAVAAVGPVNASNFGIYALSNGGAITVIADDVTSTASGAILADNDGTGAVTITANGGVTGTAGDAIIATATSGAVQVLANGGAIVSTGGNGIRASTSAGGSVEIIGEGLIDASAITIDYNGDIGMAGDPTGGDGVLGIVNSGVGAIDISIVGEVHTTGLGLYGLGVGGLNLGTGGDVAVVYQGALAGPPVGVAAVIFNPANGEDASVTIGDGSTITAANTGVTAQTVGTGDATVTLGAGVTIDPDDYGILSVSLGGDATAVSGDGNTIIVTNTDGDDTAYGVFALSGQAADDAVGDESVEILIGADNSITIDDGAGGDADGAGGIVGVATGALGGVDIDAGDGLTVAITGNSAAGVSSTTIGGDIFVTTGTGSIDVVGLDSIDLTGNFGGSVGINAQSDTGSILIQSATDIAVDNGTLVATGIFAQTGGAGVVTVVSTGQVLSSGTGISAQAIDGDVLVSSSSVIGAGSGHGILAVNRGAGDTSVLATASITSTLSNGITAANTGTGFVFVDASGGTITAGGDGIFALANDVTNSRIVQVNNTSTITANTAAVGGFGIHAIQSGSGGMLINNGGVISGSAQNGIVTVNDATVGGITIFNTGAGIGSAVDPIGDNGIVATQVNAAGAGSINIQSTGGPIFATTGGIVADANGSGAVQIFTSASSAITTVGAGSIGIRADANGGLLEIAANGAITSGGSGIVATNVGGMTTVSTTDAITATGGSGINAATSGAVLTVSNFAAVSGVVNGMLAVNGGTGTTVVNASANVTGSGAGAGGIVATTGGTGAITVNVANGAAVSGTNGSGIRTTSVGGSPVIVNIGTGGVAVPATLVTGLGTGAGSWVLDLNNAAGSTTTVNIASNGVVRSTDATVTGYDDLAIRGIGGSVVINNAGRINGRVLFSGLTGNVVFNNTSFNSWHTTGASTFSGGADVLNNSGAIFTNAGGVATSFDFGAGADTFTNSGLLVVGEPTLAASTLTITNLEAWNNSGRIVFGSAGTDMTALSDGQINDRILASGATFTGSGSSRLVMDANLGATSQTSCAVLAAADCLSLTGGSTAGSTLIRVNDASGNAFGAFNPTGIVLVDVAGAGATAASHFSLDPASAGWRADPISADGVIDKGLFFYDLTLDGKQHKLVGLPDGEAFELATFGAALQSVWYSTTGSWFERQADLRTQLPSLDDSGAGVWMKITGSSADRDLTNSYDVFGVTYSFDTSYDQSTVALIAGLDYRGGGSGKAWVVGGQIGYVDSDVNFDASNTLTSFEGMTLGVYGTYVAGPLFVDAIVNANMLDYDLQVASLAPAGSNIFTGSVDSLGVQVEGGWTIPLGANGFFEPIGSLSYLSTSIDAVDVPGAQIDWDDQTSLRLSLGGRLGLTADHGTFSSKWALVARYWNEFEGENDVTLHSAGPDLTLGDDFSGSFGEIGGTVNVFGADDRFSAFLNVGVKFKDDYTSTDASLGLRWRW
ncbi:MAG: outer rane autotransporter barrel domain, partial [Caulobacter sp.]|nr:outer rane autotransporter barrel domain [Caulobacter sp.]